jgi:hypothetical protein
VLRELTALINKGLEMQEGIQEVELLVDVAKRSISKVKKEIKAIMYSVPPGGRLCETTEKISVCGTVPG